MTSEQTNEQAFRRRRTLQWYAMVTLYNTTDQPITYSMRCHRTGTFSQWTVPPRGWCTHWTSCLCAEFEVAFDASFRPGVQEKRVLLPYSIVTGGRRPWYYDGRPYSFRTTQGGAGIDLAGPEPRQPGH